MERLSRPKFLVIALAAYADQDFVCGDRIRLAVFFDNDLFRVDFGHFCVQMKFHPFLGVIRSGA